jgi:hypothetical protein
MRRLHALSAPFRGACLIGALARLLLAAALAAGPAAAAIEDDNAPSNVYMAGAEVRIDQPVHGDVVAAAGRIHIDQPIAGDAVLGAGSIDVQSPVGEDLRGAGGIVTLSARVGHEVLLAAARIILTSGADVQGETWLAAASVALGGRYASGVRVYAREITITAETFGPMELSGERIEIREGARIHGDVVYSSGEAIKIHPLAVVDGKVTRRPRRLEATDSAATLPGLKPLRPLVIAALLAFAMLALAVFPRVTASSTRTLAAAPVRSLGLGLALFFSVPPVAVLLIITIIGIPVGVALVTGQALALVFGYVITAMLVAQGLGRTVGRHALTGWRQYAFMAAAIAVLALVTSIPYLGVIVLLLASCAGLGAMVLQRFSRRSARVATDTDEWPAA